MKNSEVKNSEMNAPKEAYVKPVMEVIEMEIEGVIMDGASDGGLYDRRSQTTTPAGTDIWGNLWNEEKA